MSYNFIIVIILYVVNLDIIFAEAQPANEANISVHCSNLRCLAKITPRYLYLETPLNDFVPIFKSDSVIAFLPV